MWETGLPRWVILVKMTSKIELPGNFGAGGHSLQPTGTFVHVFVSAEHFNVHIDRSTMFTKVSIDEKAGACIGRSPGPTSQVDTNDMMARIERRGHIVQGEWMCQKE